MTKDELILALAERLWIVAGHLGRLAERKEVRGKEAGRRRNEDAGPPLPPPRPDQHKPTSPD